jgi:hypothetical protein
MKDDIKTMRGLQALARAKGDVFMQKHFMQNVLQKELLC